MIRQRQEESQGLPLLLAVLVHLAFFGLMFFSLQWQAKPVEPVSVELWAAPPPVHREPPAPPPVPVPVHKVIKEAPPEPEIKPVAKPDIAIKAEKPKKVVKPVEAPKPKPEQKPEPKPEPKTKPKVEEKPVPHPPVKAEPKPTPKAEVKPAVKPVRPSVPSISAADIAAEAAAAYDQKLAAGKAAAQQSLQKGYIDQVVNRIRSNVVVPPDMEGNPEAVFEVTLLPTMEVLNVVKRKSSGNAAYDESIERAIRKASPWPPLPAGVSFGGYRVNVLKFRPNDR